MDERNPGLCAGFRRSEMATLSPDQGKAGSPVADRDKGDPAAGLPSCVATWDGVAIPWSVVPGRRERTALRVPFLLGLITGAWCLLGISKL